MDIKELFNPIFTNMDAVTIKTEMVQIPQQRYEQLMRKEELFRELTEDLVKLVTTFNHSRIK